MRRSIIFAAVAGLLLLVIDYSLASIRNDPVKVRMLGEPRVAVAGRTFVGVLQMTAGEPVFLSNFNLISSSWTITSVDLPNDTTLYDGDSLLVSFEAVPADPNDPLLLIYDANSVYFQKAVDLSEAAFARTLPGITWHPMGDDSTAFPGVDTNLVIPPPPSGPAVPHSKAEDGRQEALDNDGEGGPSGARNIRVYGRFSYIRDDDEETIGADGVLVRVYDEDVGPDEKLAEGVTNWDGYYDFDIHWDPPWYSLDQQPDIYVYFETENSKVRVQTADIWEIEYSWETPTVDNYRGSSLYMRSRRPSDEDDFPALHIQTDITRCWRWLLNNRGYNLRETHVRWPDGSDGAWYVWATEEIHISRQREWNEATHAHEYGHHWINVYSTVVAPDYCNGNCDDNPPDDCGHCMWCEENDHDAWGEGWPNWFADVITRSYLDDYGLDPVFFRDQDTLRACNGGFDDPDITEGFVGALLHDIEDEDPGVDDHPPYPGWQDRLSWGTYTNFYITDEYHPTTVWAFLNTLLLELADYPADREDLWETAMNCGYDIDSENPGVVADLACDSHIPDWPSPDGTIEFSWTRPVDDASGVGGYSICLTCPPGVGPDATPDIDDVTRYVTPEMDPGAYVFKIRAVDRSGRASDSYAQLDTILIRERQPVDLVYYERAGWHDVLVPRSSDDATLGDVPAPDTLLGNITSTYWNLSGRNTGDDPTGIGFRLDFLVDGQWRGSYDWAGSVSPMATFYTVNQGPLNVSGGRHTAEGFLDADEDILEGNEIDNHWAHQWIWTPYELSPASRIARARPPDRRGGWDSVVDGSPRYYNCDGLRFTTTGYWNAVWVHAGNDSNDYDCRLHAISTGADNGFSSYYNWSGRAAGCLDAVVVNRNVTGYGDYDVGVLNVDPVFDPTASSYRTEHVTSETLDWDTPTPLTLEEDEMLLLEEFRVLPGYVGPVSVTVEVDSGRGPVHVLWLGDDFDTGNLMDFDAYAVADSADGARLDFTVAAAGYNCLLLYRDPKDGDDPVGLTARVFNTPSDFEPYHAAGWHAPIVPRPADDGTPASVPPPDTLHGDIASTYLNYAVLNNSPTPAAAGMMSRAYVDGESIANIMWGAFTANGTRLYNSGTAKTVRGGRHTLTFVLDADSTVEEIDEDDNVYSEQWVWLPSSIGLGTSVTRSAPPGRTTGWFDNCADEALWYNCDGLRTPVFASSGNDGYWGAFAAMPGDTSDVDVRLHELVVDAKDGFADNLATSGWGPTYADYVLVNFNRTPFRAFDIGVLQNSGAQSYTAEVVQCVFRGTAPNGPFGPFTMAADRILDLHEFYMNAGRYSIALQNVSGDVDWTLSGHRDDLAYHSKSNARPEAVSWLNGPGEPESIVAEVDDDGYYCVAVSKAGSLDLGSEGTYQLSIDIAPVAVKESDAPPTATRLASVYPNPFNPATHIAFDLREAATVRLEIYNVAGMHVRTLANDPYPAGRYIEVWDGRDDRGLAVSSGVYFCRFQAGAVIEARKLVVAK
jgi:hypothetical protein